METGDRKINNFVEMRRVHAGPRDGSRPERWIHRVSLTNHKTATYPGGEPLPSPTCRPGRDKVHRVFTKHKV